MSKPTVPPPCADDHVIDARLTELLLTLTDHEHAQVVRAMRRRPMLRRDPIGLWLDLGIVRRVPRAGGRRYLWTRAARELVRGGR